MTRRGSSGPPRPKTHRTAKSAANWRGEDPNLEFEKSRYADPIASRELLLKHLREAPEPLTAARLVLRWGGRGSASGGGFAAGGRVMSSSSPMRARRR